MMTDKTVLLHICCAPCATTVVRRLQEAGYRVHGYFYNPNIQPEKEYYARLLEAQRLCKLWSVPLEVGEHDWDRWQAAVRGYEAEPEGGERCRMCYRHRLAAVAEKARELGVGSIATTLTLSPHKRPEVVNPIGKEVCAELELEFIDADWKKKDGFKQSRDTCRELSIYRQQYCGCKYSLKESEERRATRASREVAELVAAAGRLEPSPAPGTPKPRGERTAADEPGSAAEAEPRAKWELSPLERKQRRDKKAKPWQRQ